MAGIDRDYWLDFAKDSISKSIQRREDAATKLDEFLSWIWGIYTSIFALSSLLGYINNSMAQLIAVSQPILVIMLARFSCKLVLMPSVSDGVNADPNVVTEIIEGFSIIVADKKRKLKNAITATFISIFSICIALIGYNLLDTHKEIKQEIQLMKLKKELHDQAITPVKSQQSINDSIRLINEYYDAIILKELKMRKFDCIKTNNKPCLDSLKNLNN
ncbi:MAG: hypothetical protein QM737_02430 [Ferruginibacter sp.]